MGNGLLHERLLLIGSTVPIRSGRCAGSDGIPTVSHPVARVYRHSNERQTIGPAIDEPQHVARRGRRLTATVTDLEVVRQRAFLIGVKLQADLDHEAEVSLHELALLTDTAGSEPIEQELVKRDAPDPARFLGSGKAAELAAVTKALDIDVVVFDNELTPAQQTEPADRSSSATSSTGWP